MTDTAKRALSAALVGFDADSDVIGELLRLHVIDMVHVEGDVRSPFMRLTVAGAETLAAVASEYESPCACGHSRWFHSDGSPHACERECECRSFTLAGRRVLEGGLCVCGWPLPTGIQLTMMEDILLACGRCGMWWSLRTSERGGWSRTSFAEARAHMREAVIRKADA